jgi:hypothetical protein
LKRSPDGVDTRSEPALKHGHRESDSAAARGIFPRSFDGLVFYIPRQLVVKVKLVVADLKRSGVNEPFGK